MEFPSPLHLDDLKVFLLSDGSMRFDGGAMFHIIPRTFWEKKLAPDSAGRVEIALRSLYFELGEKKILIEAGAGTKLTPKQQKIFCRDSTPHLIHALKRLGVAREDIDAVVLTHLHRDHAGGLSFFDADAQLQVSFPNARHYVHADEWSFANGGNELSRVSYNSDDFLPLHDAGLFEYGTKDSYEIAEGLQVQKTAAHSLGHCIISITRNTHTLMFPSDIIPTRHHVPLNWTCSYDYSSYSVVEQKRTLLQRAFEQDALLFLVHELEYPLGKVDRVGNDYVWVPYGIAGENATGL